MKKFSKAKINYKKSERKIMNRAKRHIKLHGEDNPSYKEVYEQDEWIDFPDPYSPGADYGPLGE